MPRVSGLAGGNWAYVTAAPSEIRPQCPLGRRCLLGDLGCPVKASAGCTFCAIIAGGIGAEIVMENDDFVAFLDSRPVFRGHTLVVPRDHFATLLDLPPTLRDGFLAAGQDLAGALQTALGAQGTFVAMNNTISQSVPHLHMHVVPRNKGDGLRGFFWPRASYGPGEAAAYAERLRAAVAERRKAQAPG